MLGGFGDDVLQHAADAVGGAGFVPGCLRQRVGRRQVGVGVDDLFAAGGDLFVVFFEDAGEGLPRLHAESFAVLDHPLWEFAGGAGGDVAPGDAFG